jgi:Obg family GTPase CgtA-like protein
MPALERLQEQLEALGVMRMLEAKGAKPGDTVFLGDVEMEYSGL